MTFSSIRPFEKILIFLICGIYISGLFLPYIIFREIDWNTGKEINSVYYGYEYISFRIHFVTSAAIILTSFSARIAIRLLAIRTLLILLIPLVIVTVLADNTYMMGLPFKPSHQVGFFMNYTGVILIAIYGILHFRTSYPRYKQMLKEQKAQSSDLLDSF